MFITDKIWKLLEPASAIGDTITREEIEQGLKIGMYKMFNNEDSVAITADHRGVLRIGIAGGNINSLIKIEKDIIKYAKEKKYKCVDILGRIGWEKELEGYKRKAVLLRKEIA